MVFSDKFLLKQHSHLAESVSVYLTLRTVKINRGKQQAKIKPAETSGSHMVRINPTFTRCVLVVGSFLLPPCRPCHYLNEFLDENNTFETSQDHRGRSIILSNCLCYGPINIPYNHRQNTKTKIQKHKHVVWQQSNRVFSYPSEWKNEIGRIEAALFPILKMNLT